MELKQDADELVPTNKWRDIHKFWAEYKGKPRKEAVANFILKTTQLSSSSFTKNWHI